jgi:predicted RNA-binding Zn-ribbon protein involved in translation (DUF1610 family)
MDKENLKPRRRKPRGRAYCDVPGTSCSYGADDRCVECGRKRGWRYRKDSGHGPFIPDETAPLDRALTLHLLPNNVYSQFLCPHCGKHAKTVGATLDSEVISCESCGRAHTVGRLP